MNAISLTPVQVLISDETVTEASRTQIPEGAVLSIQTAAGKTIPMANSVQEMLLKALLSVAHNGEVTISKIPEHLTSTSAADMIGISRPTLMKWVRDGKIDSFKVGTHARFNRKEVLRAKEEHEKQRRAAFEEFRSFTAKNLDVLPD